jgi:elongation factor 3
MIKLLIGENIPQQGTVWKHQGARIAYVAQHAFEQIEAHLDKTPNEYIRWRYEIDGEDKEAIKKATMTLTEEEEKLRQKGVVLELKDNEDRLVKHKGVIEKLTGLRRPNKHKEFEYQVKWEGKPDEANVFVPLPKLESLPKLYAKMVKTVDEKIAAMAGMYVRPLTRENVEKQLEDIGLDREFGSHSPISQLSGGQKVKVVFAAALWRQPHIVLLDEPTNYLDRESLGALTGAVQDFGGGVVIISHNEEFTSTLCTETWLMSKSEGTGIATLTPTGADWMSETLAKALGEKIEMAIDEPEEMIDGAGNVVKLKKRLSEKDTKKRIKEIEKQLKLAMKKGGNFTDEEKIWELQDELEELKTPAKAA